METLTTMRWTPRAATLTLARDPSMRPALGGCEHALRNCLRLRAADARRPPRPRPAAGVHRAHLYTVRPRHHCRDGDSRLRREHAAAAPALPRPRLALQAVGARARRARLRF